MRGGQLLEVLLLMLLMVRRRHVVRVCVVRVVRRGRGHVGRPRRHRLGLHAQQQVRRRSTANR